MYSQDLQTGNRKYVFLKNLSSFIVFCLEFNQDLPNRVTDDIYILYDK